ncbi:hypothetical protein SAMN04488556_1698 [Halostagnicola kamekurae]|uniref:Uncharacterized protein n=1 Tax=Halostagnicola kamekurae TaxID=619731 RepID=A0A1I6QY19_9EURY|nr:hypothetical protein SAMN04488556_1698 [Halostagnicola kamekurae]
MWPITILQIPDFSSVETVLDPTGQAPHRSIAENGHNRKL